LLTGFKEDCESIDRSINLMMSDLKSKAQAKTNHKAQKKADEEAKKIEEKIDALFSEQKRERKAREERTRQTEKLLKLFEEQGKQKVQNAALGKGDSKKVVEGWVDDLAKVGMARKDAKASIEQTLSAVRSQSQSQQKTLKGAATDEAKKGTVVAAKPQIVKQPEMALRDPWILCVDSTNGGEFF
jgi:hypothetical protein